MLRQQLEATPAAWWDDGSTPPGVFDGEYVGNLGVGGIALLALLALFLGVREKSKHQFPPMAALVWAFIASTIWLGAGGPWGIPSDLVRQALSAAGIGSGEGPLGNVGLGVVALALVAVAYFVNLKAKGAAWVGIIAAVVFAAAGGVWAMPVMIVAQIAGNLA